MNDLSPPVEQPVIVNASPVPEQAGAATRDILLLLAALPALIAVVGTRDVGKIVAYISSVEFAPQLAVIVGAAVVVWRQIVTRRSSAVKVTLADKLDDDIARAE